MLREHMVLHKPSGLFSSLTFMADIERVQVVTDDGRVTSMDKENALLILAWANNHPDYETCEVY
jgi:hypothetical protein